LQLYRFPVEIAAVITDSSGDETCGMVYDISSGGVGIMIQKGTPINGDITISLALPDGILEICGDAAYHKEVGNNKVIGMLKYKCKLQEELKIFVLSARII